MKHADHHDLIASQVSNETYRSKSFLIRYCEEEVEINEIVLFRATVPSLYENYLEREHFELECQLFFSDVSNLEGPDSWQTNWHQYEELATFKNIQTQRFKIKSIGQGICEHVPVVFQDQYLSNLNLQVVSVLTDYRFKKGSSKDFATIEDYLFSTDPKAKLAGKPNLAAVD
jgi:hypothetical protein